jgi:DNA-binding transcriptional LysR family regulator
LIGLEDLMQRRHQFLNVPIEIIRTVIAISETGSLSKAGERLGLSQPAVSAQIKRLQSMVGGQLFRKTANGTTTTDLGKLVLQQARKILEANDQLLRLAGTNAAGPTPLRLGLSTLFVDRFIQHHKTETLGDLFVQTEHSVPIGKGVLEGYIDIACIFQNAAIGAEIDQLVVNDCEYPLVWVRAKDFVLSPGAPLPILTPPGDDWMIRTLTKHGVAYKIVFNSSDYHARLRAVEAGMGLTAIPAIMIPPNLVRAKEYHLPELRPIKALLCIRAGLDSEMVSSVVTRLSALFFKNP